MNIIVCVKQILDPELPVSKFKINKEMKEVVNPESIPPVISPYDEEAVELAIRLKEATGGKVVTLSVSEKEEKDILRHTLAMGADEAILIKAEDLVESDGFVTATLLANAIQKIGAYDLILCGREASDWEKGVTGTILAIQLGLEAMTGVRNIISDGEALFVEKETKTGFEKWQIAMPALLTVFGLSEKPRIPSGMGIIKASRKEIPIWSGEDMNLDNAGLSGASGRIKLVNLDLANYERRCSMYENKDIKKTGTKLANDIKNYIAF